MTGRLIEYTISVSPFSEYLSETASGVTVISAGSVSMSPEVGKLSEEVISAVSVPDFWDSVSGVLSFWEEQEIRKESRIAARRKRAIFLCLFLLFLSVRVPTAQRR